MLNNEQYDILKESFLESQRLFNKLLKVARQAEALDYDESGFFIEEEERIERHWLKLSSKIVDHLAHSFNNLTIELLKNNSFEEKYLLFHLKDDYQVHKVRVSYEEEDSLKITQIS